MDKTFICNVTNIKTNNTHYKLKKIVEDATYYITLVAKNAVGKSHSVMIELALNDKKVSKLTLFTLFYFVH